jgi:hypothetical protein
MSQIAVRLLQGGGMNSAQDWSGLRTFIGIALCEPVGAAGCRRFENRVDSKSGVRDDMSSRYISADIANVAQIDDPEKGLFFLPRIIKKGALHWASDRACRRPIRIAPNLVFFQLAPLWIASAMLRRQPVPARLTSTARTDAAFIGASKQGNRREHGIYGLEECRGEAVLGYRNA